MRHIIYINDPENKIIQHGAGRAVGILFDLTVRNSPQRSGKARQSEDFLCKFIAAACPAAGGMVGAIFIGVDQIQNNPGQISGAGGSSDLIGSGRKRFTQAGSCQQVGRDKIVALSVDPAAADNEMFLGKFFYILLAGVFRLAVDGCRAWQVKIPCRAGCSGRRIHHQWRAAQIWHLHFWLQY